MYRHFEDALTVSKTELMIHLVFYLGSDISLDRFICEGQGSGIVGPSEDGNDVRDKVERADEIAERANNCCLDPDRCRILFHDKIKLEGCAGETWRHLGYNRPKAGLGIVAGIGVQLADILDFSK